MSSHVLARHVTDCPVSIAPEYAERFFGRFEQETLEVRVPLPIALSRRVRLRFGLHFDAPEDGRGRESVHFRWQADCRWLPDLSGVVRFGIAPHCQTRIILEGSYEPPFGILGLVFDLLIGRWLARATARDLLTRLSEALERDERAFRAAHPVHA